MRHDGTPVTAMKSYLISLGVGMLVGVIYSLLAVRSPAPPLVALIGLLGMLLGEQIVPVGQQVLSGTSAALPGKSPNARSICWNPCRDVVAAAKRQRRAAH
jgi:XapX domain-containing protein